MSIPGGSNPYMQPGRPQPAPDNPYARPQPQPHPQPHQPGPPGYGYPQDAASQATGGYGPMTPPNAARPSRGPGGGLPSWLWSVLGVVVASAVWGGVLVATSGSGDSGKEPSPPSKPQPNLAGYEYSDDMCATADISAFDGDYEQPDGYMDPSLLAYEHRAVDRSSCTFYLAPIEDDTYSFMYLTHDAVWHKGSDPAGEFEALYSEQEQYADVNYDYRVEPVEGLGDEAFITFQRTTEDDRLSRVILGVRDGWFEYSLTWDAYIDTYSNSSLSRLVEEDYVSETMRQSTEATLAALREEQPAGEVEGDPDA
ncbi:hypothetical protein [Streptomyces sp. 6N223]|uniref:hypothetical protein n=1 Tax=Streptomyces sp. 6N223 TaxID=3457412 RepID=UPI003FD39525